jgi:hypothetical protein
MRCEIRRSASSSVDGGEKDSQQSLVDAATLQIEQVLAGGRQPC